MGDHEEHPTGRVVHGHGYDGFVKFARKVAPPDELPLVSVGQGDARRDYYPADIDSPAASAAMLAVCLLLCAFTVGVLVGWLLL
jgi:hypothetical protein